MSIIVVKGSNTSSPIDAISLIGSDNGTQSLNVTSPTITTADERLADWVFEGFGWRNFPAGDWLYTTGSSLVELPRRRDRYCRITWKLCSHLYD